MYKKLVKLDPSNGWRFSEVDPIALHRKTKALKEYVETCIDPANDPYEIRGQVLPLCNGILDGTLKLPLRIEDEPLGYPYIEGLLPREFEPLWAAFCVATKGTPLEEVEEVLKDGERYGYMEFEEPGDWPDVVKQHEEERKQKRMLEPEDTILSHPHSTEQKEKKGK